MPATVLWDDVTEGSELPSFTYELSLLRLVAFVRASGLYDYIHFDGEYARSVGMRDAIIATPHIEGLFSRLITDWSGPGGELRSLTLRMTAPCCAGDVLTVQGRVGRKHVGEDGTRLIDLVDLIVGSPQAPNAMQATATLALPTRTAPVPQSSFPEAMPTPAASADTPDFARDLIGQVKPSPQPPTTKLTEHEILLWCEALEDWNPAYWDHGYASTTRHGGIVAPPAMGFFFGSGNAASAGVGVYRPGVETPEPVREGLSGHDLLRALRQRIIADNNPFALTDFPEAAVGQAREDFYRPVRPGDSLHDSYQLLGVGPLKKTRVGEGHFVTFSRMTHNQDDRLVKVMTITIYMYRVSAQQA